MSDERDFNVDDRPWLERQPTSLLVDILARIPPDWLFDAAILEAYIDHCRIECSRLQAAVPNGEIESARSFEEYQEASKAARRAQDRLTEALSLKPGFHRTDRSVRRVGGF